MDITVSKISPKAVEKVYNHSPEVNQANGFFMQTIFAAGKTFYLLEIGFPSADLWLV